MTTSVGVASVHLEDALASVSTATPHVVARVPQVFISVDETSKRALIALSHDGGSTVEKLGWRLRRWNLWKTIARQWPPIKPYVVKVDERSLTIGYEECLWNGPVEWRATYWFQSRDWTL